MTPITVRYTCPECENEFNVRATPEIPAQTYGPPDLVADQEEREDRE